MLRTTAVSYLRRLETPCEPLLLTNNIPIWSVGPILRSATGFVKCNSPPDVRKAGMERTGATRPRPVILLRDASPAEEMVRDTGFEPVTPTVSR